MAKNIKLDSSDIQPHKEAHMKIENKPDYRQNFLHIVSLGFGCLSIWPYILALIMPPLGSHPAGIDLKILIIVFIFAPWSGILMGTTGIISGVFAFIKLIPTPHKQVVIAITILGIILSIIGGISNILIMPVLFEWNRTFP